MPARDFITRILFPLASGVALLLLAGAAPAESARSGQVIQKSDLTDRLTILTAEGARLTYHKVDDTAVRREGRDVDFGAVSQGDRVRVTSDRDPLPSEETRASRIELQGEAEAPPERP